MRALSVLTPACLSALLGVASAKVEQPSSVEISVWAGPGAEKDPRVVKISEHHACSGRVAVIRAHSMPSDSALEPDDVLEVSEQGVVLQRWSMPIDSIVVAVQGDRIVVPRSDAREKAQALSISSTGELSLTTVPPQPEKPALVTCPALAEFKGSDYVRCFEFHDLVSGHVRRLAYQGPCT